MMTPVEYVDQIVLPNVRDFQSNPDRRRAYLACLVTFHIGDYLARKRRNHKAIAKRMEVLTGEVYVVLQDVCNATKHGRAEDRQSGVRFRSGEDTERQAFRWNVTWIRFNDVGGRQVSRNGRDFDLLDCCMATLRRFGEEYPELRSTTTLSLS
jgi:hypothetical protein